VNSQIRSFGNLIVDSTNRIPSNVSSDPRFHAKYYRIVRIHENGDRLTEVKDGMQESLWDEHKLTYEIVINDSVYAKTQHFYQLNIDTIIILDSSVIELDNFHTGQKEFYHFNNLGELVDHRLYQNYKLLNIDTLFYANGNIKRIIDNNLFSDTSCIVFSESFPNQIESVTYGKYDIFETNVSFSYWNNGQTKSSQSITVHFETEQIETKLTEYNRRGKLKKRATTKPKLH